MQIEVAVSEHLGANMRQTIDFQLLQPLGRLVDSSPPLDHVLQFADTLGRL
jgi:hypothetical protein